MRVRPNNGVQRMSLRATADAESLGVAYRALGNRAVLGVIALVLASAAAPICGAESFQEKADAYKKRHPEAVIAAGDVKPPVKTHHEDPRIPRDKWPATPVLSEAIIGTDGLITDPILLSDVDPALASAILEALKAWRYKPALRDGKPVPCFVTISMKPS